MPQSGMTERASSREARPKTNSLFPYRRKYGKMTIKDPTELPGGQSLQAGGEAGCGPMDMDCPGGLSVRLGRKE